MKSAHLSNASPDLVRRSSGASTKAVSAARFPSSSGGIPVPAGIATAPEQAGERCRNWLYWLESAWQAVCHALNLREHRRRRIDADVTATLDQVLNGESSALLERTTGNPLAFRPSEFVRPRQYGVHCRRPRRIELVRTIARALDDGYRIRVRAFARGAERRMIVRTIEVHLPRTG